MKKKKYSKLDLNYPKGIYDDGLDALKYSLIVYPNSELKDYKTVWYQPKFIYICKNTKTQKTQLVKTIISARSYLSKKYRVWAIDLESKYIVEMTPKKKTRKKL